MAYQELARCVSKWTSRVYVVRWDWGECQRVAHLLLHAGVTPALLRSLDDWSEDVAINRLLAHANNLARERHERLQAERARRQDDRLAAASR